MKHYIISNEKRHRRFTTHYVCVLESLRYAGMHDAYWHVWIAQGNSAEIELGARIYA